MSNIIPFKRKPGTKGNFIRKPLDASQELLDQYRPATNVAALASLAAISALFLFLVVFLGYEIARAIDGGW